VDRAVIVASCPTPIRATDEARNTETNASAPRQVRLLSLTEDGKLQSVRPAERISAAYWTPFCSCNYRRRGSRKPPGAAELFEPDIEEHTPASAPQYGRGRMRNCPFPGDLLIREIGTSFTR